MHLHDFSSVLHKCVFSSFLICICTSKYSTRSAFLFLQISRTTPVSRFKNSVAYKKNDQQKVVKYLQIQGGI